MTDDVSRSNPPVAGTPVAVVDVSLRPGEEGLALVRRLRVRFPHLKLIVVGNHDDALVRGSALDAGANGFVPKHAVATDLRPALDAVLAGRRYVSPSALAAAVH